MMAVYDLEEQEQLEELKSWWQQYRLLVLLVVVVAALTFGAIQGWRYYQNKQGLEAGELYVQLQGAIGSGDVKKAQDIAAALTGKYARTGYAEYAALTAAAAAFGNGDAAAARVNLQWVIDHARDDETPDIARLRLAAVLFDDKQYDSLSALFADLRGDVLVAQGKLEEARAAYQLALDKSEARSSYRALIQVKRDALGTAK